MTEETGGGAGRPAVLGSPRITERPDLRHQEFGAVGGRLRLESRQAGAAKGGYEIQIDGGAHVQVTTE